MLLDLFGKLVDDAFMVFGLNDERCLHSGIWSALRSEVSGCMVG